MCPPLMTCTSVRSATGLTTGCALRTLAASQRGRRRKWTRMTTRPAWAVLTLMMNMNNKNTLNPLTKNSYTWPGSPPGNRKKVRCQPSLGGPHANAYAPQFLAAYSPFFSPTIVGEKKLLLHFGCPCTLPCCKCDVWPTKLEYRFFGYLLRLTKPGHHAYGPSQGVSLSVYRILRHWSIGRISLTSFCPQQIKP